MKSIKCVSSYFHNLTFGKFYFLVAVALTFVGALAWQLNTGMNLDDYVYSLATPLGETYDESRFWDCESVEYTSTSQLLEVIRGHFCDTSSRFTNFIFIILQFLPVPILKTICGLLIGFTFLGIMIYSLTKKYVVNPILVVIGILAFWLFLPWQNGMYSSAYIFNYVLPSCLWILWLYLYRKIEILTYRQTVLFALYTTFISFFHEGFTIPIGCFVFVDNMFYKFRSSRRWVLWAIMFAVVITMLFFGSGERFDKNFSLDIESVFHSRGIEIFIDSFGFFIALFLIIFDGIFSRKISKTLYCHEILPILIGCLPMFFCYLYLTPSPRTLWCVNLFSIILVLEFSRVYFGHLSLTVVSRFFLALFLGIYGIWLWQIVSWTIKFKKENEALIEIVSPRKSYNNGIIFFDKTHYKDLPYYFLRIPPTYFEYYESVSFVKYWINSNREELLFLPKKYKKLPLDSLPLYNGNAKIRGIWPYLISEKPYKGTILITCGDFEKNSNPIFKGVKYLREKITGHEVNDLPVYFTTEEMMWQDSTIIYGGKLPPLPRTFQWRTILSIDTLENLNKK